MNNFIQEHLCFLKQFYTYGRQIASFAPSSRSLALTICQYVTPSTPQVIIELGAGTGALTKVIIEKMHPDSILLCFEIHNDFYSFLKKYENKAQIIICDVKNIMEELNKRDLHAIDLMISGLPLPSLPPTITQPVLECFRKLSKQDETVFCQLTLMPWVYKKAYQRLFKQVKFQLVLKSMPPGGVYFCSKLHDDFERHLFRGC